MVECQRCYRLLTRGVGCIFLSLGEMNADCCTAVFLFVMFTSADGLTTGGSRDRDVIHRNCFYVKLTGAINIMSVTYTNLEIKKHSEEKKIVL